MICSIDIGHNGAICMFSDEHTYTLFDMPITYINNKKDVDIKQLYAILDRYPIQHIVIEKLQTIYGINKSSMFSLGKQSGYIIAYAFMKNIPLYIIPPKQWQKYMHKDVVEIYIQGSYKPTFYKSLSKIVNILGFEEVERNFKNKKRYDDGKIDAYLLAYYLYKTTKT